jgi:serine/threonine-protein kinase HipA
MADVRCLAEVRLWNHTVGAIAEMDDGCVVFEYARDFRLTGLQISPVHLPLSLGAPVEFAELSRKGAFQGLPGVFADSLPDSFGNLVIRAYYAGRGRTELAMSPVQRLLHVGSRAIGALTYHPEEKIPNRPADMESLEIATLVRDARKIVEGEPDVAIPEIYKIGSSAGGMRAKAVVLYTPGTRRIRSGYASPEAGEIPCILKFDGVGDARTRTPLQAPAPYNRVEAAYASMAGDCGVDMADVDVMETEGGYAHLLIRRFDFAEDGSRIHQHTLGGLLHVDYNDVGASSYEEYLRTALALSLPPAAIEQAYRRMVFNIVAVNQDDHVKNLSFHMDKGGAWRLTPTYDVTFAKGAGFTAQHQMRVADKTAGITRKDLIGVGATFDVKAAGAIVDEMIEAVSKWSSYSSKTGVPKDTVRHVTDELKKRRSELLA